MFSSLWTKISAFLAALVGFLVVKSKIQRQEIDNLQEELEMNNKESAITDEMRKAQEQAKKDEDNEVIDDSDWINRI